MVPGPRVELGVACGIVRQGRSVEETGFEPANDCLQSSWLPVAFSPERSHARTLTLSSAGRPDF